MNGRSKKPIQIAYVIPYEFDYLESLSPGVAHKIVQQVTVMNTEDFDCKLVCLPSKQNKLGKILKRLPGFSDGIKWNYFDRSSKYDVIYLRKPDFFSKEMLFFLEKIRSEDPEKLIILEIPSYPYDSEISSLFQISKLIKDKIHRGNLNQYVDVIVSPAVKQKKIFGIDAISIVNGIDINSVSVRKPSYDGKIINIICIAAFASWHGIDRFINGLKEFYLSEFTTEVNLHLLGEGPELPRLKKLVNHSNLSNHVFFYGQCDREQMDKVFDKCSLAVECLGIHRKDINSISSSLKSREYLAKGIPFVYSASIDVFLDNPVDFCVKVSEDESPIDVKRIIEFHEYLYSKYPERELINKIRQYAVEHVSMNAAMKPVTDYMKEALNESDR